MTLLALRAGEHLLTVNVGSASVKLAVFVWLPDAAPKLLGQETLQLPQSDTACAVLRFLSTQAVSVETVRGVAHRLVHGGQLITQAAFVTPALDAALTPLSALAPLHNPSAFQWLHGCRDLFGHDCQQMLVPDTAFFRALPVVAQTYALPAALCERYQLKRYGFHGLAHEAMWRAWEEAGPRASPSRIITLQLGGGSSMAAIVDGRPVDTTMGFTPLEGLVMATRCGDMDPGLLLWLQQHAGMDVATLDRLLHEQSGLLGMSGISGDMQVLLASDDAAASRAINVFVYRIRKYLGAFIAVLGGVDGILFGGGIGEHAAQIRGRILQNMSWAGIEIDPLIGSPAMSSPAMSGREMLQRQGGASHAISPPNAPVEVRVVAIDEARLLVQALVSGLLSTPD